jgi:hypothetical protein
MDLLTSVLTPEDDSYVLLPTRINSKKPMSSFTVPLVPIYADSPSMSSQISAFQQLPIAANIFAVQETYSISLVEVNASNEKPKS